MKAPPKGAASEAIGTASMTIQAMTPKASMRTMAGVASGA